MFDDERPDWDLATLSVPLVGGLDETGSRSEPYRLLDPAGEPVRAAAEFFVDLQARGRSQAMVRSYGMDLLRWFRFCWATSTPWGRATRAEARDFCRWMLVAGKPARPHWRAAEQPQAAVPRVHYRDCLSPVRALPAFPGIAGRSSSDRPVVKDAP